MNLINFNSNSNEFNTSVENDLSILFWLRNKPSKKTGLFPIYCRITLNGDRASDGFTVGVSIMPEEWQSKPQIIVATDRASKLKQEQIQVYNDRLMRTKIDIQKVFANLELAGKEFTALDIENNYLGKSIAPPPIHTLRELVAVWQARYKLYVDLGEKAPRTLETYDSYNAMILAHFGETTNVQDFKTADYENFRLALRQQTIKRGQSAGKTKGINYTSKILNHFSKLFELAHERQWTTRNPYQYSKAQRIKPAKIYLEADKIHALEKEVFEEESLNKAKDIFLFCAYTGFSYKDYCALTAESILEIQGEKFLYIEYRLKSPLMKRYGRSYAPIFESTQALIDKYEGIQNLPRLDNCNKLLKYIWGKINAPRNISLKNARHKKILPQW